MSENSDTFLAVGSGWSTKSELPSNETYTVKEWEATYGKPITFSPPGVELELVDVSNPDFSFNEGDHIKELYEYVKKTYDGHYAGKKKLQATDLIIDAGHGVGFCVGNIIKYAKRYGKKGDAVEMRKDIFKILHYGLILLYAHEVEQAEKNDAENKTEESNTRR